MKPVALVDLDNTLADYEGQLLADLKALAGPDEPEIGLYDLWPEYLKAR